MFNLKNIVLALVGVAAVLVIWNQLKPSPTPESVPVETVQQQVLEAKQEGRDEEKQKREKAREIEGLQNRLIGLQTRLFDLQTYLDRDSKRIFRRILHDSLPIYGAEIERLKIEIERIRGRLKELGGEEVYNKPPPVF